jgi:flagellar hook-length control protein FliK
LNSDQAKKNSNSLSDADLKPEAKPVIYMAAVTAAQQRQGKDAPANNLAATLILGAGEAAQFAKRVQTRQISQRAEKIAALTGESFKSAASKTDLTSLAPADDNAVVLDTLSLGTELTGEDLRMMWEHRQHNAQNSSNDSNMGSGTGQANAPQSDIDLRADQYAKLSQRLGEALGQRLAAQIAKGDWNVELTLKPQDLGNIEIKLNMNQGNLEASFNASEAMTRDLIVDGLPRLKETLAQSGMEVAQVNVNVRQDGQNGGNSTPGRQKAPTAISGVSKSSPATAGLPTANLATKKSAADNNGLDVLV